MTIPSVDRDEVNVQEETIWRGGIRVERERKSGRERARKVKWGRAAGSHAST
jgi:hypothetical protein